MKDFGSLTEIFSIQTTNFESTHTRTRVGSSGDYLGGFREVLLDGHMRHCAKQGQN